MSAADCLRTHRVSAVCPACHQPIEGPVHLDLTRVSPATCERCCPHCGPTTTEPAAASPAPPDAEHEPSCEQTDRADRISGGRSGEPLAPGARENGNIFI